MGKLMDMIKKSKNGEYSIESEGLSTPIPVDTESDKSKPVPHYTASWLSRVVLAKGYVINDDNKKVMGILGALNRTDGHCPCGGNGEQFRCPCTNMRTYGICKCGLFKTLPDRQISGSSEGRISK